MADLMVVQRETVRMVVPAAGVCGLPAPAVPVLPGKEKMVLPGLLDLDRRLVAEAVTVLPGVPVAMPVVETEVRVTLLL
jgi:hypothetical protein